MLYLPGISLSGLNLSDYYTSFLVFVVPALLLGLVAQGLVRSTFSKYDKIPNARGLTGEAAAHAVLSSRGLAQVRIAKVQGTLSDHYDPRDEVLSLSQSTYGSASIAAVGVAAHEAGHAIQHAEGYLPNRIRSALVPAANIGSMAGPYLAIFGIVLNSTLMINLGILLYAAAVVFYLVTLPVEIDASRRAILIIGEQGLLSSDELDGAKKVLRAAAFTYIASALAALASMARLILLARGGRSRR